MEIINENNFNEIINSEYALIDFYANWCGPCKMMSPILEKINDSRDNIKIAKVDVDKYEDLARNYGGAKLIKEICKLERYRGTDKEPAIIQSLKEEIADVLNTVEQLYLFYGAEDIEKIRKEKLIRGLERIKNTRRNS